ncbi:hypothetical protein X801_10025, partial [Opisthorchis viverrini]
MIQPSTICVRGPILWTNIYHKCFYTQRFSDLFADLARSQVCSQLKRTRQNINSDLQLCPTPRASATVAMANFDLRATVNTADARCQLDCQLNVLSALWLPGSPEFCPVSQKDELQKATVGMDK